MYNYFKKLSLMLLLVLGVASARAEIYQIGTGTTTSDCPFSTYYMDNRSQWIYTAQEFQALGVSGGVIKSIALNVASFNPYPMNNFTIKMQNTALDMFPATAFILDGWTTVYQSSLSINQTGWITFTLSTPFEWTGSNLLVQFCFDNNAYTSPDCFVYGTTDNNKVRQYKTDLSSSSGCDYTTTYFYNYVRPNMQFDIESGPNIVSMTPSEGRILQTDAIYTGIDHPSITFKRKANHNPIQLSYEIRGPLPTSNVIYTATEEGIVSDERIDIPLNQVGDAVKYNFTHAKYAAANQSPDNDGQLDLFTNNILGGEYEIVATLRTPADPNYVKTKSQKFIIALLNDMAVTKIIAPKSNVDKKYATGQIPIKCEVKNVGLNPVTKFNVTVVIKKNGAVVWTRPYAWNNTLTPLTTGQGIEVEFPNFVTNIVGDYDVQFCVNLEGATDESPENNCTPADYKFRVAYDQEPQVDEIYAPLGNLYVGRPVRPFAKFSNNGITDMSNVKVWITIRDASNTVVYEDDEIAQDIPAGITYNSTKVLWMDAYVPTAPGRYQVCARVEFLNDPNTANNEICTYFDVTEALKGTYTIGTLNSGKPRNFNTFDDALDVLYLRGIAGPVTFELTDAEYNVGDINNILKPALDFRSKIVGVDKDNQIVFKPTNARSIIRGGVRINLATGTGVGMLFGQAVEPMNPNATVNNVQPSLKKKYANSEGYITFDGGAQKAILMTIRTNKAGRAIVYMSSAKNITIKNCLIQDGLNQNSSWTCTLPNNTFNPSLYQFLYDADFDDAVNRSFTAGVVMRTIPPYETKSQNNLNRIDTINTNNIVIENNEISGTAYGVVSLGAGVLIYQSQAFSGFKQYYNYENQIVGNKIYNVGRAGIFLGFEENTTVKNNRIYNVAGNCGADAAGIILGGDERNQMWGYATDKVILNGNEISNINGANDVYGIKVEVDRLALNDPTRGIVYFPDKDEANVIVNNSIWGINPANANTNRYGIRLFSQRNGNSFDAPLRAEHFVKGSKIANNTVIMNGDGNVMNTGVVAALALQQVKATTVINNALAVLDREAANDRKAQALILYQGPMPNEGDIVSNRNAYWFENGTPNDIYRFIFINKDKTNEVIEYGYNNEYKQIDQWRYWTGLDAQSVFGDFTKDLTYVGTNPQNLRIKFNPLAPKSSYLNNRGDRHDYAMTDIDGKVRGVANQRYDIGAYEFDGLFYTSDLELLNFAAPGVYRDYTGNFADAEYIMTSAPVNVKARMRNNGNIQQTNVNVTVKIYREKPTELNVANFVGDLELTKTVKATVSSTEDIMIDFKLADEFGLNDDWNPKTYSDLRGQGYTIPALFTSMQANVTPRYRIDVSLDPNVDEVLSNNVISKVTRFYLKRANLSLIISAENSHVKINDNNNAALTTMNNVDQIAGRLNVDTLIAGMKRIGWEVNVDVEKPRYDIDLFERNGWEPRNVDYTLYRTLVWSDADDKAITRYQSININDFLTKNITKEKKNLLIGSQELVRANVATYPKLIKDKIRTNYSDRTGTNLPADQTLNNLVGVTLARNLTTDILTTGWYNGATADAQPLCTYQDIFTTNEGFASIAYYFKNPTDVNSNSKIAGVASSTLTSNVVYMGLDWRHFGNVEFMLRSMIDFVVGNGGTIVPVELLSFDANKVSNRVELNWSTASENNSSRFEVEKAEVTKAGTSIYNKIDEIAAKGNSSIISYYGPVVDRDVQFGNTYSYRLKMIDKDGSFSYSGEKVVTFEGDASAYINQVTPSPIFSDAKVSVVLSQNMNISVELFDMNGKLIKTLFTGEKAAGESTISFNASDLASGSYLVILKAGETSAMKVVQINK